MFRQLIDRMYGRPRPTSNNSGWLPDVTKGVFLERFESIPEDYHELYNPEHDDIGVPMACKFGRGKFSHVCGVADELGVVRLYDTTKNARRPLLHCWAAHSNAVFDVAWVHGEDKILTASGDQSTALWDIGAMVPITTFRGHDCSVRSVAPCPDSPAQLATGSRDGHIMLWDSRVNQRRGGHHAPVKTIHSAHSLVRRSDVKKHRRKCRRTGPVLDTQMSVTCVLYQTEHTVISSGAVDGCVKIWDTRKMYMPSADKLPVPLHCFDYPGIDRRRKGLIYMSMDPTCSRVFASYTDNTIYCFDVMRYCKQPVSQYRGHRADTFFIRSAVSPDGKYLISGSTNTHAYIWNIDKPEEWPVALVAHEEDVSAVDWCPTDITKVVTVGDDGCFRIWRPAEKEFPQDVFGFARDSTPEKLGLGDIPHDCVPDHDPRRPPKAMSHAARMLITPFGEGLSLESTSSTFGREPGSQGNTSSASSNMSGTGANVASSTTSGTGANVASSNTSGTDANVGTKAGSSAASKTDHAIPVVHSPPQQCRTRHLAAADVSPMTSPHASSTCCRQVPREAGTPTGGLMWPVPDDAIPEEQDDEENQNRAIENVENIFSAPNSGGVCTPPPQAEVLERMLMSPVSVSKHRMCPRTLFHKSAVSASTCSLPSLTNAVGTAVLLDFSHTLPSLERAMTEGVKSPTVHQSPTKRQCLKGIDTNSPQKQIDLNSVDTIHASTTSGRECGSPVKKPQCSRSLLLSENHYENAAKTSGLPKPVFFNSPTMNLPNSVLDTPPDKLKTKPSAPQPEATRKVDWLTDYRLSHPSTPKSSKKGNRDSASAPTTPKSSRKGASNSNPLPTTPNSSQKGNAVSSPLTTTPKSTKKGNIVSSPAPTTPKGKATAQTKVANNDDVMPNKEKPCASAAGDEDNIIPNKKRPFSSEDHQDSSAPKRSNLELASSTPESSAKIVSNGSTSPATPKRTSMSIRRYLLQ